APLAGLAALRDRLEAGVRARSNLARIIGAAADRLPNTTCVTMPGVSSETQVMALDLAGVAVSAGSACSSGKVTASRVLEAMGVAWNEAATAIRVSLGWTTRDTDIDAFLDAWGDVFDRLGADGLTAAPA
ncbi:MAG: aminotransferase class V-fold PLP-dependent enzyme, partial [Rhodobacterales bacterium]|nr:aminotransferase class V-fold PLP-dependent enzyme [Rhodobacterales bacterium]